MGTALTEMEKEILIEFRDWGEKKYKKDFDNLDYKTVLNEFWKEKLQ